jgi:hypothetical protein
MGERLTELGVGDLSRFFIKMFFPDPASVLRSLDRETIDSARLLDLMPAITFLRQEHLTEELTRFLGGHGYSESELRYVAERGRINVTENPVTDRQALLTPKVLAHIATRESLLLRLLEGVGISYGALAVEYA